MYKVQKTIYGTAYILAPSGVRVSEIPTSIRIAYREAARMNQSSQSTAKRI